MASAQDWYSNKLVWGKAYVCSLINISRLDVRDADRSGIGVPDAVLFPCFYFEAVGALWDEAKSRLCIDTHQQPRKRVRSY